MKAYQLQLRVSLRNFEEFLSKMLEGKRNLNKSKYLPEIQKHFGVP